MPMYQLHVAKQGKSFDPEAVELPDTKTAKRHAKTLAEGLTALSSGFGVGTLRDCQVKVTDTEGKTIARYGLGKVQRRSGRSQ